MVSKDHTLSLVIDGLGSGGAELYLSWLAPLFAKDFSRVDVLVLNRNLDLQPKFESVGISVRRIGKFQLLWHFIRHRERIYYVNLAQSVMIALFVSLLLKCLGMKRRIFVQEHAVPSYFKGRRGIVALFDFIYLKLLGLALKFQTINYIVQTKARLEEISTTRKASESIHFLWMSLPSNKIEELRKISGILREQGSRNEIGFFTFSRLHAVKQIDWAIDAVVHVANLYPDIRFLLKIAGSGPDEARLKLHAREVLGRSNIEIKFVGMVDGLKEFATDCQIFLMPSLNEGFGLALVEAAMAGFICVVNDCPFGPREIAHHFQNISLVHPPKKENFQLAVEGLVAKKIRVSSLEKDELWPSLEMQFRSLKSILEASQSRP